MADTPPKPEVGARTSEKLLEDLCVELRLVGCYDYALPRGEVVVPHVRGVCTIHKELATRGIDCRPRLERLSRETRWQMPVLLEDCLGYPERLPYVREADGIRRNLRCKHCGKAERPADARVFRLCDECLQAVLEAVRRRRPIPGIILFRTYNVDCLCPHANEDTVLAYESHFEFDEGDYGVCETCILEEMDRRRGA